MNRLLITGGSGFIGTNLVERAKFKRISVLNYDLKPPTPDHLRDAYLQGDILNLNALRSAVSDFQPDAIVHLAARCDLDGKTLDDYKANTTGLRNLLTAIDEAPSVKRVIFASSRYVHRNEEQPSDDNDFSPFTMYGTSKAEGERIIRAKASKTTWAIIRPTSIWGPWFGVPYKGFFEVIRKGLYVHPRGEKIFKSYGFVGNVVYQISKLLTAESSAIHGKVFYTADYQPVEIGEMAEIIRANFGAPPIRYAPLQILKTIAAAGNLMSRAGFHNPPLTSFRLNNLRAQMVYDLTATQKVVGPLPFSLEEGITQTVQWMRQDQSRRTSMPEDVKPNATYSPVNSR